jgi:hypothetical protein
VFHSLDQSGQAVWRSPTKLAVRKFESTLRAARCRFGVLFSSKGISGRDELRNAERELLKIAQSGVIIVSVSEEELEQVAAGTNFLSMLRDLFEGVWLDLRRSRPPRGAGRRRATSRRSGRG